MTKKETFIKEIDAMLEKNGNLSEDAMLFYNALKIEEGGNDKTALTDNGKLVLGFMKENKEAFGNLFKAKDVAEGIGITSRTVSGASRKLVTDGYLEKLSSNPVCYALTQSGIDLTIE